MSESLSEMIRKRETPLEEGGKHREYSVYRKDGMFITQCIEWQIKSATQSGGSLEYYQDFQNEQDAIDKYDELLSEWESK